MEVREINIHLKRNLTKWQKFLRFNGIEVFLKKKHLLLIRLLYGKKMVRF